MDSAIRLLVESRAKGRCEYCQLPQEFYRGRFHVEHIVAQQHAKDDSPTNLAFSCPRCNRKKGPNLSAIDPRSGSVVPIFHPRKDSWNEHFQWNGPLLVGLTATARATIALLDLNGNERVQLRGSLVGEKLIPPT